MNSVNEALELLVGRDQLQGVTGSKNNQEVNAWQQTTVEKLPVVLILHLKCFNYQRNSCTKILKKVDYPIDLKIDSSKYIIIFHLILFAMIFDFISVYNSIYMYINIYN